MRHVRFPEHELALPHWPERLDGLRVAVITDLHAGGPRVSAHDIAALVTRVQARAPDLVVLLGDYVDTRVIGGVRITPDKVALRLARLRAPVGVVAVLGNHDWMHEGSTVALALRHAGIRVLENEAVRLPARGGHLWIAGVGDSRYRDPRVGQALSRVPEGEPTLLLSHHPDLFQYVPNRVSLTLAGHMHGGQINLPGFHRKLPSRFGSRYKAGHIVEHGRHLFVSAGVGETMVPLRFRAPAEVPLLALRRRG